MIKYRYHWKLFQIFCTKDDGFTTYSELTYLTYQLAFYCDLYGPLLATRGNINRNDHQI